MLEAIRSRREDLRDVVAPRYGVTNPNPPWKTSLGAMCDCLGVCGALAALEQGAVLRMSLQRRCTATFPIRNVNCSHSSIPCSAVVW